MISFVRGRIAFVSENKIEIDTGGIGYEINVPSGVIGTLPPKGNEIELYTYLNVKEDEMSLFGFPSRDALQLFKLLIAVSGVGPRSALSVLSVLEPDELRFAVLSSDIKTISKVPGIGKKTAERIVIELRDRFGKDEEDRLMDHEMNSGASFSENDPRREAAMALQELGFSEREAYQAVRSVARDGMDTGALLKSALIQLGR